MIHLTCRLTAKNRDQLHDPTLGNRVWATFTFYSTGRETSREGRLPAHCNVLELYKGAWARGGNAALCEITAVTCLIPVVSLKLGILSHVYLSVGFTLGAVSAVLLVVLLLSLVVFCLSKYR